MGLLSFVSDLAHQYAPSLTREIEDTLGIDPSGPAPSPPAPSGASAASPLVPSGGPLPAAPAASPIPSAVRLSTVSGSVGDSTNLELRNFFDRSDRKNVDDAVRNVLGLRPDQPLPGPVTLQFSVSCRPGMGQIGSVSVSDVGFRLPPNVTRDQLEAAVQHAINCNPVPPYAIPSASMTDATTRYTFTVDGRVPTVPDVYPAGDAPVVVASSR